MFVGHGEQLTGESLDHQTRHEILAWVFLGQHQEDGRLPGGEGLGVDGAVEAEDLLQLGVQEGVQPGQHCGHDGGHGLFGGVQRRPGKPTGLVRLRQGIHKDLESILALDSFAGSQEVLHQLEHADDVPPLRCALMLGRKIFCQKQNDCRQ